MSCDVSVVGWKPAVNLARPDALETRKEAVSACPAGKDRRVGPASIDAFADADTVREVVQPVVLFR